MRVRLIRLATFVSLAITFSLLCGLYVHAQPEKGSGSVPDGFDELGGFLPESEEAILPEGMTSQNVNDVGNALGEMLSPDRLFRWIGDVVGLQMGTALRLLAFLCGILLLSALFQAIGRGIGTGGVSDAFRFCTTTAVFAAILQAQLSSAEQVEVFLKRLSGLMEAMIPILGSVWAMGGNVTTASSGTAVLGVFLTVCQKVCGETVMPLSCFCMAMALCNALAPEPSLRGISGTVKKCYTFLLGLIMTVLVACLGAQTALTSAADSTTSRAAKLISSTVIPSVGGSVGDTLRTVASGVQYLKSVIGVSGVVFIMLLLLPTLILLLLVRLVFLIAGGMAEMLGCEVEARLLSELSQMWGCMIAVVSMCSVMFILGLWIFVGTVVAVR